MGEWIPWLRTNSAFFYIKQNTIAKKGVPLVLNLISK